LNRLPEIRQFINQDASQYPNLSVNYFGGDPRIKFVTSDGPPNAYTHYTDSTQGKGLEDLNKSLQEQLEGMEADEANSESVVRDMLQALIACI